MDKYKTKLLNTFGIFIIFIYFITYISCDQCTIKAICNCVPQSHSINSTNLHESLNQKFETDDKLNLCNISTGTTVTVQKYVLNCTYVDKNNSTSFNPPNNAKTNDTFFLDLGYSCAGPSPPEPTSKYSTGSVLVIIFFTCVLSYLALGICVNYILIGARGIEMLPHLDFWKDFPALVLDGVKFLQNGCTARPSDLTAPAGAEGYDAI